MGHSHSSSGGPKFLVWLLPLVGVLLFALGLDGHLRLGNSPLDSVYKSLQLFHLHYHPHPGTTEEGEVEAPAGGGQPAAAAAHATDHLPLSLQVARFGSGVLGLALIPALFGLTFHKSIQRWFVRHRWKDHVIVWGDSSRAAGLVGDLRRLGERVVLIGRAAAEPELPSGACYLPATTADGAPFAAAGIGRAGRFVAMTENDRDNLELAVAAGLMRTGVAGTPLECHAQIGDTHLQNGLYQTFVAAARGDDTHARHQLFNYYDFAARLLAREYPMPETLAATAPTPQHFIIVGFGAFGQCVALKLVKMGQQLYRDGQEWKVVRPQITVVDSRGQAAAAPFLRTHRQFTSLCTFDVKHMSCEDADFLDLQFLKGQQSRDNTSIVFCLEDEALTLRSLLLVRETCRVAKADVSRIYIRLARPEGLGPLQRTLESTAFGPEVVFFAPDREMFSADVLLNRSLDILAKRVHEHYLKVEEAARTAANQAGAAGKKWEELSDEDRDSNREAADHMWAKLATLGYRLSVIPKDATPVKPDEQLIRELESRVEEFARVEHFRWMTWRALNGWTYGTPRDNARKLHPDMVDYDQLSEATKEKDRVIIRAIPPLLGEGRLRAERRKTDN